MAVRHGYWQDGKFIETGTKEEATFKWLESKGYSTEGRGLGDTSRFTGGGGRGPAMPAPRPEVEQRQYQVRGTTGTRSSMLQHLTRPDLQPGQAPPGGMVAAAQRREQAFISAGYGGNEARRLASGGAGQRVTPTMRDVLSNVYTGGPQTYGPGTRELPQGTAMGEGFGARSPSRQAVRRPETTYINRARPKYTGRAYYLGGSEQAYLGPVAQAEEFFLGTGDRHRLGASYRGVQPEERVPPAVLNQSTVRILTKSGPSYKEGRDYGSKVEMEDILRLYDFDEKSGFFLRKSGEAAPSISGGYGGGYGPYYPYPYGGYGGGGGLPYAGRRNFMYHWNIGV